MKIGWTSNAPWTPSGYGVQTKEIVYKLKEDGHDVAVMANYGLAGSTVMLDGLPIMGSGYDAYSNDITPRQIMSWLNQDSSVPGIGITLYDVWVYTAQEWDQFPILSWVPIDHRIIPSGVRNWFDRSKEMKWALAMSKFGKDQLIESGIESDRVFYAPHSFNSNLFKPLDVQEETRKNMDIPMDAHVTMINAANKGKTPIRKCWPEMLRAWTDFAAKRKDAFLYIHSDISTGADGVNIPRMLEFFKTPLDRVRIVDQFMFKQGIDQSAVAKLYNSSDVLLMTSRGEGFGVPAIEAQACGTPVIVTNWTAQPELVGSGWIVDGQEEWDEYQTGWWKVPNVDEITDALEKSYFIKGSKKETLSLRRKALKFSKQYSTENVYNNHWRPVLKEIENRLVGLREKYMRNNK